MTSFTAAKEELEKICTDIISDLNATRALVQIDKESFKEWEQVCRTIRETISQEVIRVAVVGAIKSGKSTFVNSLFKADHLKRGAGVVTSIVTRIRRGPYLKAKLYFKSWDEVNSEISQALTFFPSHAWESDERQFDIRRETDRSELSSALNNIQTELLLSNGVRDTNSILLDSYLKGYATVKEIISSDNLSKVYEDDLFGEHKTFVGSDYLAVYLKDVLLGIRDGDLDNDIEIADCQGSDSPNPRHLSMIQEYLLKTHLIIYVISSRTGLRQADIRFLSIIRDMGILDNIIFVLNSDFSEHEALDDLQAIVKRTEEDLSVLRKDPSIFTFSSLYNLFKSSFKSMSPKDITRFSQWESETELVTFSDEENQKFHSAFSTKLSRERAALLLKNNLERLGLVSDAIVHWCGFYKDVLGQDSDSVTGLIDKMTHHQKQMTQMGALIKNTLDGASRKIKQDLKQSIDRYFDARYGTVVKEILTFIRNFHLNLESYESNFDASRFTEILYLVFQDFKVAVDSHLAETAHPKIVRFIHKEEQNIKSQLESVALPYAAMVNDALSEYQATLENQQTFQSNTPHRELLLEDLKSIKARAKLYLPPVETAMRYSARIKTEAVMRLGFYSVIKVFQKLMKKEGTQNRRRHKAIQDGFKRMKQETERSIVVQFRDYQENMKFQYLFRLTDSIVDHLNEDLVSRFQVYFTDVSKMIELVKEEQIDKEHLNDVLIKFQDTAKGYVDRIQDLREQL